MGTENLRALRAACKASKRDGRLRYVYNGRAYLKRDRTADTIYTNGEEAGHWRAGRSSGERCEDLTVLALTGEDLLAYCEAKEDSHGN